MEMSESESLNSKSSRSSLLVIGLIVAAVVAGYFFFKQRSEDLTTATPSPSPSPVSLSPETEVVSTPSSSTAAMTEGPVKEFQLTGTNYRFTPATLSVKKGDKVKITLTSSDMPHNFAIDELNVQSEMANKGKTATVEFVADKVGTFEYYCSVGNHRSLGMVGKLTVTQ